MTEAGRKAEAGSLRVYACATCGGEIVGDLTEGAASAHSVVIRLS